MSPHARSSACPVQRVCLAASLDGCPDAPAHAARRLPCDAGGADAGGALVAAVATFGVLLVAVVAAVAAAAVAAPGSDGATALACAFGIGMGSCIMRGFDRRAVAAPAAAPADPSS